MTSLDEAIAELTAPGAPFEMELVDVRGVPTKAFVRRLRSLRELAQRAVGRRPEAELLVHGDLRLTYAEFFGLANSVSSVLVDDVGVEPGDRVAILSANNAAWCTAFWGTLNANAVAAALNGWWKSAEIHRALVESTPRVLVVDAPRLARIRDDLPSLISLDAIFVIDPRPSDLMGDARLRDAAELTAQPSDEFPDVPIAEDDPAAVLYTSGTTAHSKGVVATHRSWLASNHNVSGVAAVTARCRPVDAAPPGSGDVRLLSSPLFHVSGSQAHLVSGLLAGWRLIMPVGRFDPIEVMRLIEAERVTSWAAVPTMASRVCQHPDRDAFDLSSVRNIGYGGAPVPAELPELVRSTFPSLSYQSNIYGLTETSGVSTLNGGQSLIERPGSVGRAMLTVDIEIRDGQGRFCPLGVDGEVCVRGPHLMAGYWGDEGAIVDGWFATGDVGHLDVDGFLFITDRAKDMIIRGGENVSSLEVEDRLTAHDDVVEAAVVGLPQDDLGEEVHAVVHVVAGATATERSLQRWVADALADFKVPVSIRLDADPLPRTETGKVLKAELRSSLR